MDPANITPHLPPVHPSSTSTSSLGELTTRRVANPASQSDASTQQAARAAHEHHAMLISPEPLQNRPIATIRAEEILQELKDTTLPFTDRVATAKKLVRELANDLETNQLDHVQTIAHELTQHIEGADIFSRSIMMSALHFIHRNGIAVDLEQIFENSQIENPG
ncbi:MAG TPA: hypothetical protein PLV25_07980, partial [Opitutales bacterium]|nr:hypothetical protein [Opitutales bacterium]